MLDLLLEYESASDRSADLERICESMTTITSGEQRRLGVRLGEASAGARAVEATGKENGPTTLLCLLSLLSKAQSAPAQLMRAMRLG